LADETTGANAKLKDAGRVRGEGGSDGGDEVLVAEVGVPIVIDIGKGFAICCGVISRDSIGIVAGTHLNSSPRRFVCGRIGSLRSHDDVICARN
jgi:hypothetical protein